MALDVAGILDGLFDRFSGLASALLDAADEFFFESFHVVEVVIGELAPFLFEATFDDVPVTFDFELVHGFSELS